MKRTKLWAVLLPLLLILSCWSSEGNLREQFNEEDYDQLPTEELEKLNTFCSEKKAGRIADSLFAFKVTSLYNLIVQCRHAYKQNNVYALSGIFTNSDDVPFSARLFGYNRLSQSIANGNLEKLIKYLRLNNTTEGRGVYTNAGGFGDFQSANIKEAFLVNRMLIGDLIKTQDDSLTVASELSAKLERYETVNLSAARLFRFLAGNPVVGKFVLGQQDLSAGNRQYNKFLQFGKLAQQKLDGTRTRKLPDFAEIDRTDDEIKKLQKKIQETPLVNNQWTKELVRLRNIQNYINYTVRYSGDNFIEVNKTPGSNVWLRVYFGDSVIQELSRKKRIRRINGQLALIAKEQFAARTEAGRQEIITRVLPIGIEVTNCTIERTPTQSRFQLSDFSNSMELKEYTATGISSVNYNSYLDTFSSKYIQQQFSNVALRRIAVDFSDWKVSFVNSFKAPACLTQPASSKINDDVVFKLTEINNDPESKTMMSRIYRVISRKLHGWAQDNKASMMAALQNKVKDAKIVKISGTNDSLTAGSVTVAVTLPGKSDTVELSFAAGDSIEFRTLQKDISLDATVYDLLKKEIISTNEKRFQGLNRLVNTAATNQALMASDLKMSWNPSDGVSISQKGRREHFNETAITTAAKKIANGIDQSGINRLTTAFENAATSVSVCEIIERKQERISFYGLDFKVTTVENCEQGIFKAVCGDAGGFEIKVRYDGESFRGIFDFDADKLLSILTNKVNGSFGKIQVIKISNFRFNNKKISADLRLSVPAFHFQGRPITDHDLGQFTIDLNSSASILQSLLNKLVNNLTDQVNNLFTSRLQDFQIIDRDFGSLTLKQFKLVNLIDFAVKGRVAVSIKDLHDFEVEFGYSLRTNFSIQFDLINELKNLGALVIVKALNKLSDYAGLTDADDLHFDVDRSRGTLGIRVSFTFTIDMFRCKISNKCAVIFFLNGNAPVPEIKPNWLAPISCIEIPIGPVIIYHISPEGDFNALNFSISCDVTLIDQETGELIHANGKTVLDIKKRTFTVTGTLTGLHFFKLSKTSIVVDLDKGSLTATSKLQGILDELMSVETQFIIQANIRRYNASSAEHLEPDKICNEDDLFAIQASGHASLLPGRVSINADVTVTMHFTRSGLGLDAHGSADFLGLIKLGCDIKAGMNFRGSNQGLNFLISITGQVRLGLGPYGKFGLSINNLTATASLEAGVDIPIPPCGLISAGFATSIRIPVEALVGLSLDQIRGDFKAKARFRWPKLWGCDFCIFGCSTGGNEGENGDQPGPENQNTIPTGNNLEDATKQQDKKDPRSKKEQGSGTGPNRSGDGTGPAPNPPPDNTEEKKEEEDKEPGDQKPTSEKDLPETGSVELKKTVKIKDKKSAGIDYRVLEPGNMMVVSSDLNKCLLVEETHGVQPLQYYPIPDSNKLTEHFMSTHAGSEAKYNNSLRMAGKPMDLFRPQMNNNLFGILANITGTKGGPYKLAAPVSSAAFYFNPEASDAEKSLEALFYRAEQKKEASPDFQNSESFSGSEYIEDRYICKPMVRLISEEYFEASQKTSVLTIDKIKYSYLPNTAETKYFIFTKPFQNPSNEGDGPKRISLYYTNASKHEYVQYAFSEKIGPNHVIIPGTASYCLVKNYPYYINGKKTSIDFLVAIDGNQHGVSFFPVSEVESFFLNTEDSWTNSSEAIKNNMPEVLKKRLTIDFDEIKPLKDNEQQNDDRTLDVFSNLAKYPKAAKLFNYKILSDNKKWPHLKIDNGKAELFPYYDDNGDPGSLKLGLFESKQPKPIINYTRTDNFSMGQQLFDNGTMPRLNINNFEKSAKADVFGFHYKLLKQEKSGLFLLSSKPGSISFLVPKGQHSSGFQRYEVSANTNNGQAPGILYLANALNPRPTYALNYSDDISTLRKDYKDLANIIDEDATGGSLLIDQNNQRTYFENGSEVILTYKNGKVPLTIDRKKFTANFEFFAKKGIYKLSGLPMAQLVGLINDPSKFVERAMLLFSVFEDWEKNSRGTKINPWALFR